MTDAVATPAPAPRRRRRRIVLLVVAILLVVVLAIAAVVAERAARSYAVGELRSKLAPALGVTPESALDVRLGSGSLLLQVLQGEVGSVSVSSDAASLGGLHGSVQLSASGVHLRSRVADRVSATITVPSQSALSTLVGGTEVSFSGGLLVVTIPVTVLGARLSVGQQLTVSASGGAIVFTPKSFLVNGATIAVSDLASSPLGPLLSKYTKPRSACIDAELPAGAHLTGAAISGSTLTLTASGTDVALEAGDKGSCS